MKRIRIGTRASQLAIAQTRIVSTALNKRGFETEIIEIRTVGDLSLQPLTTIGGKGVFISKIQDALLANEVDVAVHSLKDMPATELPGLTIAAIPQRENPRDALILPKSDESFGGEPVFDAAPDGFAVGDSSDMQPLAVLARNARIGTGSVRRKSQLLRLRGDILVESIRGNIDTRIKQLDSGKFDGLVLASAGLIRLGLQHRISFEFAECDFAPAVGQGALALEVRSDDHEMAQIVEPLNHQFSSSRVFAERAMLAHLQAGCHAPVGAVSSIADNRLHLNGVVLSQDGQQRISVSFSGPIQAARQIGIRVAELLIERGAAPLLNG